MKTETVMWLLPIIYMLHDFEEIILMSAWGKHQFPRMEERFRSRFNLLSRAFAFMGKLSTASFALAVSILFAILSGLVFICVEQNRYEVWSGLLLVFFIHLVIHIGQSLFLKEYIPAVITSLAVIPYCIYALVHMGSLQDYRWERTWIAALVFTISLVFIFPLVIKTAGIFEAWINRPDNPISGASDPSAD